MSLATCSPPYKKALQLQALLEADAKNPASKPLERASSARMWKELELLKRMMRGLPAHTSQSIKPIDKQAKRKRITGPIEPE